MKTKTIPMLVLILGLLPVCQTPQPSTSVATTVSNEFSLVPGQSLSIQQGDGKRNDFRLQTFTDQNGRSPNVQRWATT